jgi:glycosyltransferase involved in cell wall biosynthesis
MVILSHPTGNENVRAAAAGLKNAGVLKQFHTSLAVFPGSLLDKASAINSLSELRRRSYDPDLATITKTWPWVEVGRLASSKLGLKNLIRHENGFFSIDSVYTSQDKKTASLLKGAKKSGINAVYAYEDCALHTFKEAKKLGMKCFYDLPIGYWRAAKRILQTERERWPEWVPTLLGLEDSAEKLSRKDEELQLADQIFVASTFTASTLNDYPGKLQAINVIPYGFPDVGPAKDYTFNPNKRKLKLIFVGGLSQRKGIADLFAAVENLKNEVELTVVGNKSVFNCAPLDLALSKHRWIPSLPHHEVLKLMRGQDVLVFPSLFEGFGLVITEAMSQGTPVITTGHTAGPDLIVNNQNGWLIDAGSVSALQKAIENILNSPDILANNGINARGSAKLRPWSFYSNELGSAVSKRLSNT